jgi:signal transduction histidine kinase
MEGGVRHICPAGFTEIGFPIIVHDHVVGLAMTGQLFSEKREIANVSDFVAQWKIFEGCENKLEKAKQELVAEETQLAKEKKSRFLVTETRIREIADLLGPNIERLSELGNSRYRDFRRGSEAAFRHELLGFIQNRKRETDFFHKHLSHLLERMRTFWAFDAVYLLDYSFKTKDMCMTAFSHKYRRAKYFGIPGKKEAGADVTYYQMHPCSYLHIQGNDVPRHNPLLTDLLPIFEKTRRDLELEVPEGKSYFFVLIPFLEEVYAFALAVRDPDAVSCLQQREKEHVSELCQEAILGTCIEVIHAFGDVTSFLELRAREKTLGLLAHRLWQPLRGIIFALDYAQRHMDKDRIYYRSIDRALDVAHRLWTTSSTILATLTIQEIGEEFFSRRFRVRPIGPILKDAIKVFREEAEAKRVRILSPVRKDKIPYPDIEMNYFAFSTAIQNIIYNAVKYSFMPPHWKTHHNKVTITCWHGKGDAGEAGYFISVEDWGVGIDLEHEGGLIFERHRRGRYSEDRFRLGTGLGLDQAIYAIETLHRGRIGVVSTPKGEEIHQTVFTIYVPLKQKGVE